MARVMGERQIPARVEKVEAKATCDLCPPERRAEGQPGYDGSVEWAPGVYDRDETVLVSRPSPGNDPKVKTHVQHGEGTSYPEGGDMTYRFVDICPSCMTSKVFPWLESQGAKIQKREVDY